MLFRSYVSGNTGTDFPDHSHPYTMAVYPSSSTGGGSFAIIGTNTAANTGGASARHQHSFGVQSGGISATHYHNVAGGTTADGDTEARPNAISFYFCIKT